MYEIHFAMDTPGGVAHFGVVKNEQVYVDQKLAQQRVNWLNKDNTTNGHDGWYYLETLKVKGEKHVG